MTLRTLIRRSLRYHWRSHLGVVIGAAIGSAALIGALIVGDSVKGSLRENAKEKLGWITISLSSGEHLFGSSLIQQYRPPKTSYGRWWEVRAAVGLQAHGMAGRPDGTARANGVNIFALWETRDPQGSSLATIPKEGVVLNQALAGQLSAKVGDEIVLRVQSISGPAEDMVMTPKADASRLLRLKVHAIASADQMGNLSLNASQSAPLNAFLNLQELGQILGVPGKANTLLLGDYSVTRDALELPAIRKSKAEESVHQWRNHILSTVGKLPNPEEWVPAGTDLSLEIANNELQMVPHVSYWGLEIRTNHWQQLEVIAPEVFLKPAIGEAVCNRNTNDWWALVAADLSTRLPMADTLDFLANGSHPLLTYLANLITAGTNATPYSMVTAAGAPWTPSDLRDDEIVLNQWLAEDLQAKPGDMVTLVYFDPESGARLTERTNTFRVHSIVPMQLPWADRTLMPQFPGIEKAETTAEWDTAFPLVHKIRPQDDDYWTEWRGTPKAFVTLAAGQKMWANRFGNLTAIRFPVPDNFAAQASQPAGSGSIPAASAEHQAGMPGEPAARAGRATVEAFRAVLEKKILATLKPEELGLRFEPVREQALQAAEQSQDFGGLFIGFSLFVIVAALLLMALLFQFSLEQRTAEIGTLLALGFTPRQVRRLFLREGAALAFLGGLLGTLGGIGYARAMLHGLTTLWSDAVGGSALKFFVTPGTLAIGLLASTVVAVFTLWLALRKQARQPARVLLAGGVECGDLSPLFKNRSQDERVPGTSGHATVKSSGWSSLWRGFLGKRGQVRALHGQGPTRGAASCSKTALLAFAAAVGLVGWTLAKGDTANAGAFFGAGALVLVAGLAWVRAMLAATAGVSNSDLARSRPAPDRAQAECGAPITLRSLAFRGLTRRRARSVATAAMLACGTFLIVSIGVFRLDANRDATKRTSGTGGFALVGESTMPVVADLNTKAGRETFALNEADFADVNVVQFRVRQGDEASCLNLNRAQKPRLLGVGPAALAGRFAFARGEGWPELQSALNQSLLTSAATNEVPAIGDAASIQWAMGKKVGDTLDYVDERGQPFKVRIVGAVANSILQGQLIIDEAEFIERFPGESGYKYFLIDAPTNRVADVSAKLSRALQDVGLELTPAPQRLAQFNAVQNTYLGTFQILGGLGLLLGSAGLGIVVLRNVLERRGELAVLLAVGWRRATVNRLVLHEHLALLGLGLAVGLVAAVVAVLPSLVTPGSEFPWLTLSLTLAAVLANGVVWTWLASRIALRGDLLAALRNE